MTDALAFPVLEPYRKNILKALQFGGEAYTIEDVEQMIIEGTAQMWVRGESVIVTEIVKYPRAKHLHLFLAGGDLDELDQLLPEILEWGKGQGCRLVTLSGRRGWERSFLADQGWKPTLIVMEKEL